MKKAISFILALCVCLSIAVSACAQCYHPKKTIVDNFEVLWPHRVQVDSCSRNNTPHYHQVTDTEQCYVYACVVCGGAFEYVNVLKSSVSRCESPCPPGGRIRCSNGAAA